MHPLEIIVPFILAGFGASFTGLIYNVVQDWDVYGQVDELYVVLPALLGLKGNLQLTLASRMSTQYQLGNLQDSKDMLKLTTVNMALNQCFSSVVSLMAALLAIVIKSVFLAGFLKLDHCLLLIAVSLLTSSVVSFVLDITLILILQISIYLDINPDNVASPLSSSLGDMGALIICTLVADMLFSCLEQPIFYWLSGSIIVYYSLMMPCWIWMSLDNPHTKRVLLGVSYWYPLIAAMGMSSMAGVVFKSTVGYSDDIALFSPVIGGVSGNVAAVQASRLSTKLHKDCQVGELPPGEQVCEGPWNMFISQNEGYEVTRLLIAIIVPGQIVYYLFCIAVDGRIGQIDYVFTIAYLMGSFLQATTLMYLTFVLTYFLWSRKVDPDSCAIPYISSIGDLLGACIVTGICFLTVPGTGRILDR